MLHGGDIYHNQVNMDFSMNVNPFGIPKSVRERMGQAVERIDTYPEPTAEKLRAKLAGYHKAAPEQIICGNGASELLMACVRGLYSGKQTTHIMIPIPSFYGYQWAAESIDARVHYYSMKQECRYQLDEGFLKHVEEVYASLTREERENMIIFLANPNNPTGAYIDPDILNKLLANCEEHRINVILDECFMEMSDDPAGHSMIPQCKKYPHLWIIRAFTKTYAMPGIRLGYMIGNHEEKLSLIRHQLPEWNVSLPAQEAGIAAMDEMQYLTDSRDYIQKEREYLEREIFKVGQSIKESDLILYPSVTNYLLFYSTIPFYDSLLDQGILIRDCGNFAGLPDGYYRIAVRTHEENRKLIEKIWKVVEEKERVTGK